MSRMVEVLYPLPDVRRTPLSLLLWWESRRWLYNKVVGTTGLFTLAGLFVLHPDRADFFAPGLAVMVLAYGVMANACYSLGWLVELAAWWAWREKAPDMGPLLFREGLIFSVGLTLLPMMLAALFWVARLVTLLVP